MVDYALTSIVALFSTTLLIIRLAFVLPSLRHHQNNNTKKALSTLEGKSIMVLLGSGGHTGEMIRILSSANQSISKSKQLYWVISSGDSTSVLHLRKFQINFQIENKSKLIELPRARKVGEGLMSSIKSTIKTILSLVCNFSTMKIFPDVLIVNGPGTSVPICYWFFLVRLFGIHNTKILYIESLARVNDLSLSGKLCYLISDRFIVQWRSLVSRYPNSECYGILV